MCGLLQLSSTTSNPAYFDGTKAINTERIFYPYPSILRICIDTYICSKIFFFTSKLKINKMNGSAG